MWLKIFCFGVIVSAVFTEKDELLQSLHGLERSNKIEISVRTGWGWRCCDGALFRRGIVVARAGCLGVARAGDLTAVSVALGGNCTKTGPVGDTYMACRSVWHVVMHPWFDLALLTLRTPYYKVVEHANITHINKTLRPHGVHKWIKYYLKPSVQYKILSQSLVKPYWYSLVIFVLPTGLYALFYIYYMDLYKRSYFIKRVSESWQKLTSFN